MAYSAIQAWQQANSGNRTVQAAAQDLFYNSASGNLSTQQAVSFAKQMTPVALNYQRASSSIAQEFDLRRLGAETSAARGLTQLQGDLNFRDNQLRASTERYGADRILDATKVQSAAQMYGADRNYQGVLAQASATRYGYDQQLRGVGLQTQAQRFESTEATKRTGLQTEAQRYGYDQQLKGVGLQTEAQRYESDRAVDRTQIGADADRYGYDRGLEGQKYSADRGVDVAGIQAGAQKYGADRGLEGVKYGADRGLEGIRDTNRSDEDKIRITGGENRKTLIQGTDETLRLRADARGAIRTAGRSFYG